MSFSNEVKKELCKINNKIPEIDRAETYGMLLFCHPFSAKEIRFRTENECAAKRFSQFTAEITQSSVETVSTLTARKNNASIYKSGVVSPDDCKRIFDMFGHEDNCSSLRVNMANIEFEPCAAAFLRGAFLTCGHISSPENEYRLDFSTVYKKLSEDLCRVITETTALAGGKTASPKISNRRGSYVVYLKGSEDIADLLTLMGATTASMEIMQVRIQKSIDNEMTRKINFQLANTDKSLSAAAKQVKAIKLLQKQGELEKLSEELQMAARLRLEHPTASLKELLQFAQPSISKSGLNHRLNKLTDLAETKR